MIFAIIHYYIRIWAKEPALQAIVVVMNIVKREWAS